MEESGTPGQGRGLATIAQGLIAVTASAILFVLSFPPFNIAEAAYVFAVPLLTHALFSRPFRGEGWMVYMLGWVSWIAILFWLRNFTRHLEIPLASTLGWLALLALSAVVAVFWWGWTMAALHLVRRSRERSVVGRIGVLFMLAGLWVVMEWIRGVIFTGLPWAPLALSQWQRPLILQVASLTGSGGVSFILVAFNIGLAYYIHNLWFSRKANWWRRLSLEFYTGLALLFAAIGFGLHSSGSGLHDRLKGPILGLVQPNVGAVDKWNQALISENLGVLEDLSTYAGYLGAELVLWPEAPTPMPVKGNDSMQEWVEGLSRRTGLPFLMGNVAREGSLSDPEREWYNAVFTVDPGNGVDLDRYYAKRHLVPFGEYVPLSRWLPFVRKVVPVDGAFHAGKSAAPLKITYSNGETEKVGILICYEDIFPGLARDNVLNGADWHFVATNDGWYGEEAGAYQHAAHSVLRAVETRRPVVRCGNAGWSGWIDAFGHIRHVMTDDTGSVYFQGVETIQFSRSRYWEGRLSPYVRYGEWFTATCVVLLLIGGTMLRFSGSRDEPVASRARRPLMGGLRGKG